MKKVTLGLLSGLIIGIIDVIPMIFMQLPWDANLSALVHWIVVGFLIGTVNLEKIRGALKGLLISVITMIPILLIVTPKTMETYLPMSISTIMFGLIIGYLVDKYGQY